MRYGKFLEDGGTIGFVAPSFGCNIEPYFSGFNHAQEVFEDQDYRLVFGVNVYEGSGIGISNKPEICAREFMDGYLDPESDVLISCGGGELMCEILDYVDFEAIAQASPKWFMGYSDNTNLTFLLATLCDTASVYGPCAATFGMKIWHECLYDAMGILRGEVHKVRGYDLWEKESLKDEDHPLEPYHLTEPKILTYYPESPRECAMEGRLLGGCLDTLVTLSGTKYDRVADFNEKYKDDGIIWFLEACDLTVFSIRRALWQLDHNGWLSQAKGFIFGRPYNGAPMFGLDQYKAVTDILGKYNVPIIMDVDLGHLPPAMPLVCGSYARIRAKGNDISVEMEYR